MSLSPFQFKQFSVGQDRCAMKIGTDGVLLGAWAPIEHAPNSILDVGAGTGVIALQLAQRSNASLIDAIEIDEDAYEQCTENFEESPWNDRLFCYHASFQEFVSEIDEQYDLIVSNPPFYSEDYKTRNPARNKARFSEALPTEHLINGAALLLSERGVFATIIPESSIITFLDIAKKAGFYLNKLVSVKGTPNSPIKRYLLALSFKKTAFKEQSLIIETKRHDYTKEYLNLVQDFYLKM